MAFGTYLVDDPLQARITTLFIIGIAAVRQRSFWALLWRSSENYQTIGVDDLSKLKGIVPAPAEPLSGANRKAASGQINPGRTF